MIVTIWRHGEAGAAMRDELRELTPRGATSVAAAAEAFEAWRLEAGLPTVDRCDHSPLVRTTQTASIIAPRLVVDAEPCDGLAPGASYRDASTYLKEDVAHQLLVSHQPFVSQLISYWTDDVTVEPLMPGGWATVDLLTAARGGAQLIRVRSAVL